MLIEAREAVTNASQDRDFKLHNLTVTESKFFFARLALAGSDNLITIYHTRTARRSEERRAVLVHNY